MKAKTKKFMLSVSILFVFPFIVAFFASTLSILAAGSTVTWTGADFANDTNWTNGLNWSGGTPPSIDDDLVFPTGVASAMPNNNFPADSSFNSLTLSETNYFLSGNSIIVAGGITDSSITTGTNTIDLNAVSLSSPQSFTVINSGENLVFQKSIYLYTSDLTLGGAGNITINGNINSAGGDLIIDNTGTTTLKAANYQYSTIINQGTVMCDDSSALGTGTVFMNNIGAASLTLENGITINNDMVLATNPLLAPAIKNLNNNNVVGNLLSTLTLVNSTKIEADDSSTLTINSHITGDGSPLDLFGPGIFILTNSNDYTGITNLTGGELSIFGSQPTSDIDVTGGILSGNGTTKNVSLQSGTIAPSSLGVLYGSLNTGSLTMDATSIYTVNLNGSTTPGTDYDSLNVTGAVTLNTGASLNLAITEGYTPVNGNSFTIINNDGNSDLVTGEFNGMPEGSTITVGTSTFDITYQGGDGNDIVLTCNTGAIAGTRTWNGAAGNPYYWTNKDNWQGGTAPLEGYNLIFPSGVDGTPYNDFTAGTSFNSIAIEGGGYSLNGLELKLVGGILDSVIGTPGISTIINLPLVLDSSVEAFTVNDPIETLAFHNAINLNGNDLNLEGVGNFTFENTGNISGPGNLNINNTGKTTLKTPNTHSPTNINGGLVDGATADVWDSGALGLGNININGNSTLQLNNNLTFSQNTFYLNSGGSPALNSANGNNVIDDAEAQQFTLQKNTSIGVDDGSSLTINQQIVDSGSAYSLTKTGLGTLILTYGDIPLETGNTYSGLTYVYGGTLSVFGKLPLSNVDINGGTLNGNGTIKTLELENGQISPSSPGNDFGLISSSDLAVTSPAGTNYTVDIGGATVPGIDYDSLAVTGTVTLEGTLDLKIASGYTPANGEKYTIINNDSSEPVIGTFNGKDEGSTITIGADTFTITYAGGTDNNDVVLTCSSAPVGTTSTWSGTAGDPYLWSEATNWLEGVAPAFDNDLVFPVGANKDSFNDITTSNSNSFNSLTFEDSGYSFGGFQLFLAGGITDTTPAPGGTNNIPISISLTGLPGPRTFTVSDAAETLVFGQPVFLGGHDLTLSGAGNFTFNGQINGLAGGNLTIDNTGTTTLTGNNTNGATTINSGTVNIQNNGALGLSDVNLNNMSALQIQGDLDISQNSFYMNSSAAPALQNVSGNNTINNTVVNVFHLQRNTGIGVEDGGSLTIKQMIDDDANGYALTKSGLGKLILANDNTYSGATNVTGGELSIFGAQGGSNVFVSAGSTLSGNGTTGMLILINGGISPSSPATIFGALSVNDFTVTNPSVTNFSIDLGGTTAGTDHDAMNVANTVDLNGAILTVSLAPGYTPIVGNQYTIINNTGATAISNSFGNLPNNGDSIVIGPATFVIDYYGGDSNDVVLTCTNVVVGTTFTWTGLESSDWLKAGGLPSPNWDPQTILVSGNSLIFPSGATTYLSNNNSMPGQLSSLGSITFSGNGYNVFGTNITPTNSITDTSSGGTNTLGFNFITLGETQGFSVENADERLVINSPVWLNTHILAVGTLGTLDFNDTINGAGQVRKIGSGTVNLNAANSQNLTVISDGTMKISDSGALGDSARIDGTGSLQLDGSSADLTITTPFEMQSTANPALANLSGSNTIDNPASEQFVLKGDAAIAVNAGSRLAINQQIIENGGAYGLTKSGTGNLSLTNNNTYTGNTNVNDGELGIYGSQPDSNVIVTESTLSGNGTTGTVTLNAATLAPDSGPGGAFGALNTKNLTMDPSSTYNVDLGGTNAGANQDSINVTGAIDLGSATLNLTLGGEYFPSTGDTYVIINNDGTADAITGTFVGRDNGSTFNVGDSIFMINYDGGDGNDIVVTCLHAAYYWNGSDTNWSTAITWNPAGPPPSGSNLYFTLNIPPTTLTNDLGPGPYSVYKMTFTENNYFLEGSNFNLATSIIDDATGGLNQIGTGITLEPNPGPHTIKVTNAGETLTLSSAGNPLDLGTTDLFLDGDGEIIIGAQVLGASGMLIKNGSGTAYLTNDNTYTGNTLINNGIVGIVGSQPDSNVIVNSGGTLAGLGVTGAVTLNGGTLGPSRAGTDFKFGVLATKDLTMDSSSTYAVDLQDNLVRGTDYDSLNVIGAVNLNNAALEITIDPAFVPLIGNTYTIINNDDTDLIGGIFIGKPEGSTITVGGNIFSITYTGGDGNDVVLTYATSAYIWNGADASWNTNLNWTPNGPIADGSNLFFNGGSGIFSMSNDIVAVLPINLLMFNVGGYEISGNPLTLLTGINDDAAAPDQNYIYSKIILSGPGPHSFMVNNKSMNFLTGGDPANVLDLNGSDLALEGNGDYMITKKITGNGNLTINSSGFIVFTPLDASDYVGNTVINAGIVKISSDPNLVIPDNSSVTVASGATLDLDDNLETIGSLAGEGNINLPALQAILTVGANNTDTEFSGILEGAGNLVKTGTGTLILSGNNSYTGTTTISNGKLVVNGSQAASAVTVQTGATLGGTGTIGDLASTGGAISPGLSPGILNTGNVTLDGTSSFNVELNGTTAGTLYDQLNVTGTVDLADSNLNVTIGGGYTPVNGDTFKIIQSTGAVTNAFKGLTSGASLVVGATTFTVYYNANDVTLLVNNPAPSGGGGRRTVYVTVTTPAATGTTGTTTPPGTQQSQEDTQETQQDTQEHGAAPEPPPKKKFGLTLFGPIIGDNFFIDANGHWARKQLNDITNTCRVAGYADAAGNLLRIFHADKGITRAELFTMMMKCKYGPLPAPAKAPFPDIPRNHWSAAYVNKAKELGMTKGYPDGLFRPNWTIARAEALKIILFGWFQRSEIDAAEPSTACSDIPQNSWYAPFFNFALDNGLIRGFVDAKGNRLGLCKPALNMTRAEAAEVIMAIEALMKK